MDVFVLLQSVWQAEMSFRSRSMCFFFRKFTTLSSTVDDSLYCKLASVSTVVLLDVARASDIMTSFILVYFLRSSIRDSMYSMRSSFSSLAFCSTFTADSRDAISFWSLHTKSPYYIIYIQSVLDNYKNNKKCFKYCAR